MRTITEVPWKSTYAQKSISCTLLSARSMNMCLLLCKSDVLIHQGFDSHFYSHFSRSAFSDLTVITPSKCLQKIHEAIVSILPTAYEIKLYICELR